MEMVSKIFILTILICLISFQKTYPQLTYQQLQEIHTKSNTGIQEKYNIYNTEADTINFFPLAVANKWQYFSDSFSMRGGYSVEFKSFYTTEVTKDTSIGGKVYFKLEGGNSGWWRYDRAKNILYNLGKDSESVYMDFNQKDTVISVYLWRESFSSGYEKINGTYYSTKTHSSYDPYSKSDDSWSWANNIGKYGETHSTSGSGYASNTVSLICAIIKDGDSTRFIRDSYRPVIEFNETHDIKDSLLSSLVVVKHHYSSASSGFIDSVIFRSFYKKDNSTINNNDFSVEYQSTDTFKLAYPVRMSLLKNGYKLYYSLIAKDKGIIPNYTTSPSMGTYVLDYNLPDLVNNARTPVDYNFVYQNYPNPFNPVTSIRYRIGSESKVKFTVYNSLGEIIKETNEGTKATGDYEISFNAVGFPSGIYFYEISTIAEDSGILFRSIKKMTLLK